MSIEIVGTAKIENKAAIQEIDKRLRDNNDPLNYFVCQYKEGTTDVITLVESGEGTYESFQKYFQKDKVAWVAWRLNAGDNVSQRSKFILICWCGEKVKIIQRVQAAPHGKSLESLLGYMHVTIQARDLDEVEMETIREKVRRAGGVRYDHTEQFNGQQKQIETDQRTQEQQ